MIQSMTGYARSERKDKGRVFVLELRSVNHKYCDISIKLPKTLLGLEGMIKRLFRRNFRAVNLMYWCQGMALMIIQGVLCLMRSL